MKDVIVKNSAAGFIFGIVIALIAYFGNFPIEPRYIWIIPFFLAVLTAIGSLAAILVVFYLGSKRLVTDKSLNIIGFLTASLVNTVIAATVALIFPDIFLHREFVFLYFAGLAMGAVYGIYRYRIDLMNERLRLLEEISDKNARLQEASRQLAIYRERNRMGRELHDSISQGLHGLVFSIHSLQNTLEAPSDEVDNILRHMQSTTQATLEELRSMIEELKPSLLSEKGLEETLRTTVDLFSQRRSIPVRFDFHAPDAMAPEIEMAIYRITQEALGNIEKHAAAQRVIIELSFDANSILFTIKDDGKGFIPRPSLSGHGLSNMRLRAEELKGAVDIISKPGLGTSVVATFPRQVTS